MARKSLNPRQVEVLQWIADGCPEGVWEDFTYKTTAVALQGRRLAKLSKRGGWYAEITDDGRYYMERGAYPGEPALAPRPVTERPSTKQPPKQPSRTEPEPGEQPKRAEGLGDDKLPIIVPAQLRNPHPAVAALRDDKSRLSLTASVRGRALRVLQALATEAEAQGWTVRAPRVKRRNEYGYSHFESANHLIVETGEQSVGVRLVQLKDRSPHVPTEEELRRQRSWGSAPPKYDHTPNDYLRIELDGGWECKQSNFSEGSRGPIDRKLRRVIDEIAYRSERAMERRLQAEAERLEREQQWRVVHDRAWALFQEAHRAEVLGRQADNWRRAGELRAYVEAMRQRAASLTADDERAAALQWVDWASDFAESLDPLNQDIAIPVEVEPKPEALKPFLGGWSPYEPRGW